MADFPRYAIYYAPARGSELDRFGASLLGYDPWNGGDVAFPAEISAANPDWHELTSDARKYGFHATLKAPFGLREGRSEHELISACATFAAAPRSIPVIKPVVNVISGFIAVVPDQLSPSLQEFAADCVRAFEPFRAALTPEDRARRKPEKLTERQVVYLDQWGYPYVMDEFRFHMTLTERLDSERSARVLTLLRERFATVGLKVLPIDRIALFRQNSAGSRFHIVESWPLADISVAR
jgi:putative phosphonate metabolism protein